MTFLTEFTLIDCKVRLQHYLMNLPDSASFFYYSSVGYDSGACEYLEEVLLGRFVIFYISGLPAHRTMPGV